MNWHKLRMRQISAPTVKLIRKVGLLYTVKSKTPGVVLSQETNLSQWCDEYDHLFAACP